MALPIADDPVFIDRQEQESSSSTSSTSIPANHHPANGQQRINTEDIPYLDMFLYLMVFFLFFCFFANLLTDGRTIYGLLKTCDVDYYGTYYIVNTLFMILLGSLFFYHYFVARSVYILKIVSIITGCLYILDLNILAFIVIAALNVLSRNCYSFGADKNGLTDPKLQSCVGLIEYNFTSACGMFLFSIIMSLLQILRVKACLAYYAPRRNE